MLKREIVFELMKKNNGILKSRQATEAGIDNKTLQRMNQAGEIERVEKGIYINPDQVEDDYLLTSMTSFPIGKIEFLDLYPLRFKSSRKSTIFCILTPE